MCLHCIDNGLGVTGSADDVVSVLMINETVSVFTLFLKCFAINLY